LALPKAWMSKPDSRSQPERVRLALEELGPTYIKLGQAISTRTDLLPPEYIVELTKLQDNAPCVPYEEVAQIVEAEMGRRPEMVFASFEREPMAAASLAQVHRAVLSDGSQVVVKVQRPGLEKRIAEDLEVLRDVAQFLTSNTDAGKRYDFQSWFEEFEFMLLNELDYRREGRNADLFRENFASESALSVPKIYWDYTTQRVITMQEVSGMKISDNAALDAQGIDRDKLAETCARVVFTEIFCHGFFHADPHPGNFFVLRDGTLAIIDTGMVGRLDEPTRNSLTRVTLALSHRDAESLVDELMILGIPHGTVDRHDLKLDLARLINLHMDGPSETFSLAQMFSDVLATAAEHNIRVPSDLLFLAKTLAMCEGVSKHLDPDFPLMEFANDFLEKYYRETRSPKAFLDRAEENYSEIAEMAIGFPKQVRRLFGQVERGELMITSRLEGADRLERAVHTAANRLSMSVLVAGMVAGLSVLTLTLGPSTRQGIGEVFVRVMLFGVLFVAGVLLVSIWRSSKA
jgi:ubiquinone biosynthesis protein